MALTIEHIAAFNIALLAAVAAPGPALLYFMRDTLADGARAGLTTALGLASSAACWTLAALLGLDALFTVFPWAYTALKFAGAAFLIWIAWTTWRNAGAPAEAARRPTGGRRAGRAFLINLGNPKSVLFAAAVLLVIFPPNLTLAEQALIVGNHIALEMAFYAVATFALSRAAVARRYLGAKKRIDQAAALIMGGLGLRLAGSN
ncbi:MAG: LysE family translocator [Pseudomonadota bacterium]